MKINFLKYRYILIYLLLCLSISLQGCNNEDDFPHAGNASVQGELTYIDVVTGNTKEVPIGAEVEVFFENNLLPDFTVKTTENGKYSFKPQAIGNYTFKFKFIDSTLQFSSALVKPEDIDTLKANQYKALEYSYTKDFQIAADTKIVEHIVLNASITGIRITAKDALGNKLSNVQLCVYNNESFYNLNFPNCAGSIKYINTNDEGIALLAGLETVKYYINARAKLGNIQISNHYLPEAQIVHNETANTIKPIDLILK